MIDNEKLTRLRALASTLTKQGLVSQEYEPLLAVVGECNLPSAHIIYYYINYKYHLAIRTTGTAKYVEVNIAEHTDSQRAYTINKWMDTELVTVSQVSS